jgi:hypothetical protein
MSCVRLHALYAHDIRIWQIIWIFVKFIEYKTTCLINAELEIRYICLVLLHNEIRFVSLRFNL